MKRLVNKRKSSVADSTILEEVISNRFAKLCVVAMKGVSDLNEMASMTDNDLVISLLSNYLSESAMSIREQKRVIRRAKSRAAFFGMLKEVGGGIKAKDVASLLNVTRQTVNNRLNNNKLIALKEGGDFLFPVFQLKNGRVLPYLEDVNQCLPEDLSGVARISFFVEYKIEDELGTVVTPFSLLSKESVSDNELFTLKREASLFGRQITN